MEEDPKSSEALERSQYFPAAGAMMAIKEIVFLGETDGRINDETSRFETSKYLFGDILELQVTSLFSSEGRCTLTEELCPARQLISELSELENDIENSKLCEIADYSTMTNDYLLFGQYNESLHRLSNVVLRLSCYPNETLAKHTELLFRVKSLLNILSKSVEDFLQACAEHESAHLESFAILLSICTRLNSAILPVEFVAAGICGLVVVVLTYLQSPHSPWICPEWVGPLTAKAIVPNKQVKQRVWVLEAVLSVLTQNKHLLSLQSNGQVKCLDVADQQVPGDWLLGFLYGLEKEQVESSYLFTGGIPPKLHRGRLYYKLLGELKKGKSEPSQMYIRMAAWTRRTLGETLYRQVANILKSCHFVVQSVRFSEGIHSKPDSDKNLTNDEKLAAITEIIRLARGLENQDDRLFTHFFLEGKNNSSAIDLNCVLQVANAFCLSGCFRKEQVIKLFKAGLNKELGPQSGLQRLAVAKRLVGKLSTLIGEISRENNWIPASRLSLASQLLIEFYREGLCSLREEFLDICPRLLQPFLIAIATLVKHQRDPKDDTNQLGASMCLAYYEIEALAGLLSLHQHNGEELLALCNSVANPICQLESEDAQSLQGLVLDFPRFFRPNPKYDKLFEERLQKIVQEGLLPLILQNPVTLYPKLANLIDARRQHPHCAWLGLVSVELIRRGITEGIEQELSISLGLLDHSSVENNMTDDIDEYFANQDRYDSSFEATVRIWKEITTQIVGPNIQILESFVEAFTKKLSGMSIHIEQTLFQLRRYHASIILNCKSYTPVVKDVSKINKTVYDLKRFVIVKPSLILHWYLNHYFLERFLKSHSDMLDSQLRELTLQSKYSIQILEYSKNASDIPSLSNEYTHIGQLAIMLSKNLPKSYVENFLNYLERQIASFQPGTLNSAALEKVASVPLLLLDPTVDRIGVLSLDAYDSVDYANFLQLNNSSQHLWMRVLRGLLERVYSSGGYKYLKLQEAMIAGLLNLKLGRGAAKILQTNPTLKHSQSAIKDLSKLLLKAMLGKVIPQENQELAKPQGIDDRTINEIIVGLAPEKIGNLVEQTLMTEVRSPSMALVAIFRLLEQNNFELMKSLGTWIGQNPHLI